MSKRQKITPERLAELRAMPYQDYLKTQEWLRRRAAKLEIAEHRCQLCNGIQDLQVHHRTYERLGGEKMSDLLVLCSECHLAPVRQVAS
jgi:5-methylcytosine-specific restriction endonuclease McrA